MPGQLSAMMAFLIWGLLPLYWKSLQGVNPLEILSHRIVGSFAFLGILVLLFNRRGEVARIVRSPKLMGSLLLASLMIGSNWLVYIWAVNTGHVLETSLGYYINPLLSVLLGVCFLGERLGKVRTFAVLLAALGVLNQALHVQRPPWIALFLAVTFAVYGFVRKITKVRPMESLMLETLFLVPPALLVVGGVFSDISVSLFNQDDQTDLLLLGAGVATAVPFFFYLHAAARLKLSTLGFFQYISPSCQFLLGVFVFREPFAGGQVLTFILIWVSLLVFSVGAPPKPGSVSGSDPAVA